MTRPDPARPQFFAAAVSARAPRSAGTAWVWSRPYDALAGARAEAKRLVDAGEATLAFLVQVGPGAKRNVLRAYPESARRIIDHYEDLWGQVEEMP